MELESLGRGMREKSGGRPEPVGPAAAGISGAPMSPCRTLFRRLPAGLLSAIGRRDGAQTADYPLVPHDVNAPEECHPALRHMAKPADSRHAWHFPARFPRDRARRAH